MQVTDDILNKKLHLRQDPIFVVGFPRSGTTLVQTLIAAQGDVVSFPETHFFDQLAVELKIHEGRIAADDSQAFLDTVAKYIKLDDAFNTLLGTLLEQNVLTLKQLFEVIVIFNMQQQIAPEEISKMRWLEKTPLHSLHIELIAELYPKAEFIYVLRNPVNVLASYKEVHDSWGEEYKPIEINAQIFLESLDKFELFKENAPDKIMLVRFESLVGEPSAAVKNICDFLHIEFEADKVGVNPDQSKRMIKPEESWKADVVGKAISSDIANRKGKKGLTLFEKSRVYSSLREVFDKYDYPAEDIALPAEHNGEVDFGEITASFHFFCKKLDQDKHAIEKMASTLSSYQESVVRKNEIINEKQKIIEDKNRIIENKNKIIEDKNTELKTIYHSKLWKILLRIKKVYDMIV